MKLKKSFFFYQIIQIEKVLGRGISLGELLLKKIQQGSTFKNLVKKIK